MGDGRWLKKKDTHWYYKVPDASRETYLSVTHWTRHGPHISIVNQFMHSPYEGKYRSNVTNSKVFKKQSKKKIVLQEE